jgi:hypothetical protein
MALRGYEDFVYGTMFRDREAQDAKQELIEAISSPLRPT